MVRESFRKDVHKWKKVKSGATAKEVLVSKWTLLNFRKFIVPKFGHKCTTLFVFWRFNLRSIEASSSLQFAIINIQVGTEMQAVPTLACKPSLQANHVYAGSQTNWMAATFLAASSSSGNQLWEFLLLTYFISKRKTLHCKCLKKCWKFKHKSLKI